MKFFVLLWLGVFLFSCQHTEQQQESLPYYNTPDFTPHWITQQAQIDTLHSLAAFRFLDQNNQPVADETLRGKIHIANFFFTVCPSLCPRMMDNLKQVQEAFRSDPAVQMVSFSVTPERDSVPVLRVYATKRGILDNKWHLLTGDRAKIYEIARKSYFADENLGIQKGENDFLHTENVLLVDKNLHIRGIYNSTLPLEIQHLITDIKTLKNEE